MRRTEAVDAGVEDHLIQTESGVCGPGSQSSHSGLRVLRVPIAAGKIRLHLCLQEGAKTSLHVESSGHEQNTQVKQERSEVTWAVAEGNEHLEYF